MRHTINSFKAKEVIEGYVNSDVMKTTASRRFQEKG
jgi:hypothetical protein